MIAPHSLATDREERLHEVLLDYLEADARGQAPDTRQFLEAHAEFADELAEFLACRQRVQSIVAPLRGVTTVDKDSRDDKDDKDGQAGKPDLRRLGDFHLVREIGRGGMGMVYEAEQLSLSRRVAVKVLPFAAALDPKQLHRFKNEAQTAALLHHPNIVPVYAVGCEAGVHYFAMQFIEGRSLAAVVAERRPDTQAGKPELQSRSQSTLRDARIAELGLRAAQALEYAHQQGVVHRDIKPANLLLDQRGELWITDFGLAMFLTGHGVTISGELVGTLRYMSPEQALGKRGLIDHRTDIYSLGATLYELLTLQPVFAGQDGQELLYQIASQEPILPRSLDRTIAVDLETILLKALAKNPAERYGSAGELADDLQRFLEHKPILARRPTLLDKTAKWARRHRTLVAAGLVALLLLIGGQMVSHYFLARQHSQLQQKSREADEQRERAEANFRQARRAVDFFVELSDEEMFDKPHLLEIRMKLLEAALTYYQGFIEQHGDDPTIQAELEDSRSRAARILQEIIAMQDTNKLKLLALEPIQRDLRLTDNQQARIAERWKELVDYWKEHAGDVRQSELKLRELILTLIQRGDRAVAEILTPDQRRRLRQIAIQQLGIRAFRHPTVIKALGLTLEQRHALLRRLQIESFTSDDLHKLVSPDASLKQIAHKVVERQRQWIKSIVQEELSAEQQARWKELTGEPLEGSALFFLMDRALFLRRQNPLLLEKWSAEPE
jgi:serine/threonine protein kinase